MLRRRLNHSMYHDATGRSQIRPLALSLSGYVNFLSELPLA